MTDAYARIHSVLTKSKKVNIDSSDEILILADMHLLGHESELNIIRKICEWPRLIELAAKHNEPHRIAFYLYELASEFHAFWSKGRDTPSLRFIDEENIDHSHAKIAIARSVAIVISNGLGILGVKPMEEMR